MTLGALIREKRTQRGMSQEDLAAAMHLTQGAVSVWERDEGNPSLENLKRLADVLGVPRADLMAAV